MSEDPALPIAVPFTAGREGFSAVPYQDIAGIWTNGFGAIYEADGKTPITAHTPPVTREEAMYAVRDKLVKTYLPPVRALGVALTPNQAAALASFCYNIGPAAFRSSNVAEAVMRGQWALAADRLMTWNKARNPQTHQLEVSQGLINRRRAERELFLGEDTKNPPRGASLRGGAGVVASPVAADAEEVNADDLNQQVLERLAHHG